MELSVRRIDIHEGRATAEWLCTSPALPEPVVGHDRYTIADGKIVRLEVQIQDDDG